MLSRKIEKIVVHNLGAYQLGESINERKIFSIQDHSKELNTGRIDSLYLCVGKDGELLVTIENCPVVVEYSYIEEED